MKENFEIKKHEKKAMRDFDKNNGLYLALFTSSNTPWNESTLSIINEQIKENLLILWAFALKCERLNLTAEDTILGIMRQDPEINEKELLHRDLIDRDLIGRAKTFTQQLLENISTKSIVQKYLEE